MKERPVEKSANDNDKTTQADLNDHPEAENERLAEKEDQIENLADRYADFIADMEQEQEHSDDQDDGYGQ